MPTDCPSGSTASNEPPGSRPGIPSFTRSPETQAATTQQGIGAQSQRLVVWAKQLNEAVIRPDGFDADRMLQTLSDMANDPALPTTISDAALVEYAGLICDREEVTHVQRFLREVQREAEATAGHLDMGSSTSPISPTARSFAGASASTAPAGSPPPFVRGAEQPGLGQEEVDPFTVSPALRASVNPRFQPRVEKARELILAHPDWTTAQRVEHLMENGKKNGKISRNSAVELDVGARHGVAFGMSDDNREILFGLMLQHAGWMNNPDFASAMANKLKARSDAGSTNPDALRAAAQAAKPILSKGGSLADLTYENLRRDIPEEYRQSVKALLTKPAGYVTAGPVSPGSPFSPSSTVSIGSTDSIDSIDSTAGTSSPQDHPGTASAQQLQQQPSLLPLQQLSPVQAMDESEIQRLLQTPFVLPSPIQVNDDELAESARKRQRVEGGFTTPLAHEVPMPITQLMPMTPVALSMPMVNAVPSVSQIVAPTAPIDPVQTPALQTVQPQMPILPP